MTIDARAFNLGNELGTVDGWEYRRCSLIYRRSADGMLIEWYCIAAEWDATPAALAARYAAEIAALRAENEELRVQLKEREWQPLPAPAPAPPHKPHCDQPGCEYVAKDSRDLGRHRWHAHKIRGVSAQAQLKIAKA